VTFLNSNPDRLSKKYRAYFLDTLDKEVKSIDPEQKTNASPI
jgi:hypothetical protein